MPLAGWTIAFQLIRLAAQGRFEHVEVRGVAPGPASVAVGSVARASLDASTLGILGPDQGRWLALARRSAGDPLGSPSIERNGFADGNAISSDTDAITIGVDPFGVERARSGTFVVEVADRMPRSRWDISARPGAFTTDRSDPTLRGATRSFTARSLSVSGPVATRIQFTGTAGTTRGSSRPVYISGLGRFERLSADVDERSETSDWRARLTGAFGRLRWSSGISHDRMQDDAAGLGGQIGPSSAVRLSAHSTTADASWKLGAASWRFRGGVRVAQSGKDITASAGRGLIFAGRRITGGPDAASTTSRDTGAAFVSILEGAGAAPAWLIGVAVDSESRREDRDWNSEGQRIIERPEDTLGVVFTRSGRTTSARADRNAALLGHAVVVNSARAWVRLGLRADAENGFAPTWSPRISAGFAAGSWLLGANAGVFTNRFNLDERTELAMRAAVPASITGANELSLLTEGTPARRRDVVIRGSATRRIGAVGVAFEETATLGRHLGGLNRVREDLRLIDRVDTRGTLNRFESHLRIDAGGRGWSLAAHAQHTYSVDDTDGLFSLPATTLGRASERGPSLGVSRWSTSAVAQSSVRGFRVLLSSRFATGTPYSLLSGLDPSKLLSFSGRSSPTRNAERMPAIRDVSIYVVRRVPLPRTPVAANVGVRFENLVGALAPTDIARTAISPLAGRAAGAAADRSLSMWVTFGRR